MSTISSTHHQQAKTYSQSNQRALKSEKVEYPA